MAGEWAAVVGAVAGAGIVALTTGFSLWFTHKAEERRMAREDRLRAEDRAWALRQQNVDERKALYVEVLRAATGADDVLEHMYELLDSLPDIEEDDLETGLQRVIELRDELDSLLPQINVFELDKRIGRAAKNIRIVLADVATAVENGDHDPIEGASSEVSKERRQLHLAIRADLGIADLDAM